MLLNWELGPCEGLQRGLGGGLHASRYLGKNTGVGDGSLHLYRSLTFRIYIMYLGCVLTFLAQFDMLVDRIGT